MSKKYDVIVIGGGHNGLTTAALLAQQGREVLVLEKRAILGGVAAGEEFHPGYKTTGLLHDTSGLRTSLIRSLSLEKYGLKTSKTRPGVALLSKEGKGVYLSPNTEEAAKEIAKFSQKDAEAYIEYRSFIDKISSFIQPLMTEFPPDLSQLGPRQTWALGKKGLALKRLGKKTMLELLKVAPMSVADFLHEKFETEFLKAGLAGPAIFASYAGPRSSFTTFNLLLWECCACENIIGGPQALVSALAQAAKAGGATVRTEAPVSKILLDSEGKATGVRLQDGEEINTPLVAASCTPRETFFNLLANDEIDYPLEQEIRRYRSRGVTAKVNLALHKPIVFKCDASEPIAFARTGNTLTEMEKAFDPVKYRQFSQEPVLDVHLPSISNPELAPAGHSVAAVLVHFAPHHFDAGWTSVQKEKLGDAVVKTLAQYAPGLAESIVAREVLSPLDLENRYGLSQGQVHHGEQAVDQMIARPVPSCARYATPISGLYLCGSGSFPGGGITCGPGALAARVMMMNV